MICPKCNRNNLDTNTHCYFCNTPLVQTTPQYVQQTQNYRQIQPQYNVQPQYQAQNQPQYGVPTAQLSVNNKLICPGCGHELPLTARKCYGCKTEFNAPIQVHQSQTMKPCPVCGNMVSKTANMCPYCGNNSLKKVANPMLLDALAIFAIAIAVFAYTIGYWVFSYGVMLVCLIVYWLYYSGIKDNPEIDSSKVKQSLTVITILFVVMFCISFVFTIRFV